MSRCNTLDGACPANLSVAKYLFSVKNNKAELDDVSYLCKESFTFLESVNLKLLSIILCLPAIIQLNMPEYSAFSFAASPLSCSDSFIFTPKVRTINLLKNASESSFVSGIAFAFAIIRGIFFATKISLNSFLASASSPLIKDFNFTSSTPSLLNSEL